MSLLSRQAPSRFDSHNRYSGRDYSAKVDSLVVSSCYVPPAAVVVDVSPYNLTPSNASDVMVIVAPAIINLPVLLPTDRKNFTIRDNNSGVGGASPISIVPPPGVEIDSLGAGVPLLINILNGGYTLTYRASHWYTTAVAPAIINSLTLPAPLTSIAGLSTSGNELIYTITTNTYSTSPLTMLGRTLLGNTTQGGMQSTLGVTPGSTVQEQNALLQGLANRNPVGADKIFYSTGVNTFAEQTIAPFGRSLLAESSAATTRTTIGAVQKAPSSTDTALTRWSGVAGDALLNSGILVDNSDNLTLPGAANLVLGTGNLAGITQSERAQLQNINSVTISNTQWGYLGALDQPLTTSSTPTFNGLNAGSQKITSLAAPVAGTDATNKTYVDNAVATGTAPLQSVDYATSAFLPNAPSYNTGPPATLTSGAGGGTSLLIDGYMIVPADIGKRVLVKDQGTVAHNGVYTIIADGSGIAWQLQRASDFSSLTPPPFIAGTSVFVNIGGGGTVNSGTTWALQTTVTTVGADPVSWIQVGGVQNFTAGTGISAAQLGGAVIQVEKTAAFTLSGNALELANVSVPYGGTGQTSLALGNVLIGQGTGAVDTSKAAPGGAFVGTSDTQGLTNKTITDPSNTTRATQLATAGADVVLTGGSAPGGAGYVLASTGATAAGWVMPTGVDPARAIRVYQGAPNVYPNYSTLTNAIVKGDSNGSANGVNGDNTWTTSASNYMTILIYPGTYIESNPIVMPKYTVIRGMASTAAVVLQSNNATANFFQASVGSQWFDIEVQGAAGTGNTLGTAFLNSGVIAPTPKITNCVVRNYYWGWECVGTGSAETAVMLCHSCTALVGIPGFVMDRAFGVTAGGILESHITNATGFFAGTINIGYFCDNSIGVHYSASVSYCNTAYRVQNNGDQRITGGNAGLVQNFGFDVGPLGTGRFSNVFIQDDTATNPVYANQLHFRGDPTLKLAQTNGIIINASLVSIPINAPVIGTTLDINPYEPTQRVLGEFSVGFPGRGYESIFGKGDSHTLGMTVFFFDNSATAYTNVTNLVKVPDGVNQLTLFPDLTATGVNDAIYIGGSIETFPGLKIDTTTTPLPSGGNVNLTDPPSYAWKWEYWDGAAWIEFRICTTLSTPPYMPFGRDSFLLGETHVRFSPINKPSDPFDGPGITYLPVQSSTPWVKSTGVKHNDWTQRIVNGVNSYWVRLRLTNPSGLTRSPVIDRIKLHTNRIEIDPDGYLEFLATRVR